MHRDTKQEASEASGKVTDAELEQVVGGVQPPTHNDHTKVGKGRRQTPPTTTGFGADSYADNTIE